MFRIEDQVSDSGYTTWDVLDTDREFPLMCSCNDKEDAEFIVESLNCIDKQLNG